MKKISISIVMLFISMLFISCSGGASNGGSGSGSNHGTSVRANLSFNIKGANLLQANRDIVESLEAKNADKLTTYKFMNAASQATATGRTNLMSIDENGSASVALDSDLPIKIMYSVVNPVNSLVYLALDTGDDNLNIDYNAAIASENCAFYEVNATDNSFKCLAEGKLVQKYDDEYMRTVSNNQKPIQFDSNGNVYFLATNFTREDDLDSWCENKEGDSQKTCEDNGGTWNEVHNYTLNIPVWNPKLYKYNSKSSQLETLTQDGEEVEFFTTLKNGNVVYLSRDPSSGKGKLMIKKTDSNDPAIDFTGDIFGVEFFTTDTQNSVLFGETVENQESNQSGQVNYVRIVQLASDGKVKKTTLNTSRFGQYSGSINALPGWSPRKIIVADDGKLYGVFEGGLRVHDANGSYKEENLLSVYQMLPFVLNPKVELNLGDKYWWDLMGNTPFQIAKGFLYYKERVENENLGSSDCINIVDLNSSNRKTILKPQTENDTRYAINDWRLSGDYLYFSALDKNRNVLVTAKIDTTKVNLDTNVSEYLTIQDTATASDTNYTIQDISILKPQEDGKTEETEVDVNATPTVNTIFINPENRYSMSVNFSKYMDTTSVSENLQLKSSNTDEGVSNDGVISYMPIWIYKTLHMVPDLTANGLDDDYVSQGLSNSTTYTLDFQNGIQDKYGLDLVVPADINRSVTIIPATGWYVWTDNVLSENNISSGDVAKFAGVKNTNWYPETYLIKDINNTQNFRIEYSVRNLEYVVGQIVLWDTNSTDESYDLHRELSIAMSSTAQMLEYKDINNTTQVDGKSIEHIANGSWIVCRLNVYGNRLQFSYSRDGKTFQPIFDNSTLRERSGNYKLLYRVTEKIALDNIKISTLNSDGTLATNENDILDETFESFDVNSSISPTLNSEDNSTGLSGWDRY